MIFRFLNLGYKVYWYDEVHTSLRISGYVMPDLIPQIYTGRILKVGEVLETYQYPTAEKSLPDSLNALKQHPEHSPLYYLLARFWMQTFSHSVATIRSLSAFISLLVFPATYWLCLELFQSTTVGLVGMAIIAISPFHVLYAQEARPYSLWTVTILLSSAALLQALRVSQTQKSPKSRVIVWGIYALTIALGLYTHLNSILVYLGHGLYVISVKQWRKISIFISYILANLIGILLFFPWLLIIIQAFSDLVDNTSTLTVTRPATVQFWGLSLSRVFIDFNQGTSLLNPLLYLILFLTAYTLYILVKTTPFKIWFFPMTLIGVTAAALILPDIILGGQRSTITRYAVPCYLGVQITLAYVVTAKITGDSTRRQQKRWKVIFLALIFSGILSCTVNSVHAVWWNKSYNRSRYIPDTAQIVNQAERPLVISDSEPGRIVSFLHKVDPDVDLQLVFKSQLPLLPQEDFGEIFLYRPSEELIQGIQQTYNVEIEKAYKKGWLWRVVSSRETELDE